MSHTRSITSSALWVVLLTLAASRPVIAAPAPSTDGIEFFEKRVRPLLVENCYKCHTEGVKTKGGFALDHREALLRGGDAGVVIVPGNPDKSKLIEAVRYKNRDLQMPPKGALSAEQVRDLEAWVKMGAPDPREAKPVATAGKRVINIEEGRKFWSFVPVANPTPPAVKNGAWVKSPADAFILAELEKAGLQPAPAADKRTVIRRATFDLIGLPPTPAEVEAFSADDSSDAFSRVIERLLATPQYGERWGRHWLDVARYADSNGMDENIAYGNSWRYRDYVVRAFNDNKPYDRFLIEQIAGDLLPANNSASREECLTATGFLALGAKVLAEPDNRKLEMDIIDEQLDTMGKAFLGMTFGCCRCHDHKFDPVPTADYYAMAAIFRSTKSLEDGRGTVKYWYQHSLATPEQLEAKKKYGTVVSAHKSKVLKFKAEARAKLKEELHAHAAGYLAAAAQLPDDPDFARVAAIAKERHLRARYLLTCRQYLARNSEHPFFEKWRELASAGKSDEVRNHYGKLFADAVAAMNAAKATVASKTSADAIAKNIADPNRAVPVGSASRTESRTHEITVRSADPTKSAPQSGQNISEPGRVGPIGPQVRTTGTTRPSSEISTLSIAPALKEANDALNDIAGFLAIPDKEADAFDPEILATIEQMDGELMAAEDKTPDPPALMCVADGVVTPKLAIHLRGSYLTLGKEVERGVPQVMLASTSEPAFPTKQSGRLELARWMASGEHPLTARVMVNRIWRWHFGRGIVGTTDNFGILGDKPSHPGLLDWLARHFVESGWNVKEMHRLIMNSSAYQMASLNPTAGHASPDPALVDPENRLLWRANIQRLEAEEIRDAVLAACGSLDEQIGGKTIPLRDREFVFNHTSKDATTYETTRRAIYIPIIRNHLYNMLEQFDYPDPTMPTGSRNATVVAPQALIMMNSPLVMDCAEELATKLLEGDAIRVGSAPRTDSPASKKTEKTVRDADPTKSESQDRDEIRVQQAYAILYARPVTPREMQRALAFLKSQPDRKAAWTLFCHTLMAANEFIYLR